MSDRHALEEAGGDLLGRIGMAMKQVDWDAFLSLTDLLPRVRRTFVAGSGRSGLVARSFGMRLMHAGLTASIPGETITPAAGKDDLLVAISCTGQIGVTHYLAQRAKQVSCRVAVLTATPDSPLARQADKLVLIPVDEPNIVVRACVFEHVAGLCLDAVFNVLSERMKLDLAAFRAHHANLE